MHRNVVGAVIALCLAAPAWAIWVHVPFEELVLRSDAALIGTLSSVDEHTEGGIDYGKGLLLVEKVVSGTLTLGDELVLRWSNESDLDCPRVEHRSHAGVRALWLVTLEVDGTIRADYPRRFLPLSDAAAVQQAVTELRRALRRKDDRRLRTVLAELSSLGATQ